MKKSLFGGVFALLCLVAGLPAQTADFPCGAHWLWPQAFQDSAVFHAHERLEKEALEFFQQQAQNWPKAEKAGAVLVVPVVVHLVHDGGPENLSDAQVQQAILWLNEAFANTGPYDRGSGVNTEIQFCLARRTPDNQPTNGITRDQNPLTELDVDKQDKELKDINRWNTREYLNIWVVRKICSTVYGCAVAAYAYPPSWHGSSLDGIVVEASFFGKTAGNGGLVVHEAGHYLGLYHTFEGGCNNADCLKNGDRVCDTPPDQSTAYVPCDATVNTCSTDTQSGLPGDLPDMTWNYLDYGDYQCMHDFTPGQTERMRFFLEGTRKSLLAAKSCLPPCPAVTTAAFTPSATVVDAGQLVVFTNQSQNFSSLLWTVDGVTFGTSPNPGYTFTALGLHTVTLTVQPTSPLCEAATVSAVIQVLCPVKAAFTVSNQYPEEDEAVVVTNNSQQATQYEWFLDGVLQPAGVDTLWFVQPGIHTLRLVAKSALCSDARELVLTVLEKDTCYGYNFMRSYQTTPSTFPTWTSISHIPGGSVFLSSKAYGSRVVMKLNLSGEKIWAFSMEEDLSSTISDIIATPDGGVLLLIDGQTDFLVKLDANGQLAWSKAFFSLVSTHKAFACATNTADGGLIIGGMARPMNLGGVRKAYVLKIDAAGNEQWSNVYYPLNDITDIVQVADGGFLAVGSADGAAVIRLDASGKLLWNKVYDYSSTFYGFSFLLPTDDGNYLTGLSDIFDGTCTYPLVKISPDGTLLWVKEYHGNLPSDNICFRSVTRDIFGGYRVVGAVVKNGLIITHNFIARFDSDGIITDSYAYPAGSGQEFNHIEQAAGGYIISGRGPQSNTYLFGKMDQAGNMGECNPESIQIEPQALDILTPEIKTITEYKPFALEQATATLTPVLVQDSILCQYLCDTLVTQPEICTNNLDDDGDGLFDCLDPDCNCAETPCTPGQTRYWYFGDHAGLDFSTDPPTARSDGQTKNWNNNSATASDSQGNLLFYSDGENVYNRFHQIMPNGKGLASNSDFFSTQALILPHPGQSGVFYLFTVSEHILLPLGSVAYYTIIDMRLDGGRGDVVANQKKLLLLSGTLIHPRLASVRSCSFDGYWIVFRDLATLSCKSFRLDPSGLLLTPKASLTLPSLNFEEGQMKLSPNGQLLAEFQVAQKALVVYDFDPYFAGTVSMPPRFTAALDQVPYGLEFSPDGRFLYVTSSDPSGESKITQFDLQTPNSAAFAASATVVAEKKEPVTSTVFRAMQLGPDGKIYISQTNGSGSIFRNLHVIHQPNRRGADCQFQKNALLLASGAGTSSSLCNFPSNYFAQTAIAFPPDAPDTVCDLSNPVSYFIKNVACNIDFIQWQAEGLSSIVTSNYQYASVHLLAPGEGNLIITAYTACGTASDTLHLVAGNAPVPKLDLGPDQIVCDNGVFTFNAGSGFARYRWQNGSPDSVLTTLLPGKYWVDVWDRCNNRQTDTVTVKIAPATVLDLGPDRQQCPEAALSFVRPGFFNRWKWTPASGGCDTCQTVTLAPAATTTCHVLAETADGCLSTDSLTITVRDTMFFGIDTTVCRNEMISLLGLVLPADTTASVFRPALAAGECDSLWAVTVLGIDPPVAALNPKICPDSLFAYGGAWFPPDTTVLLIRPAAMGCDTLLTLTVSPLPAPSVQLPPDTTLRIGTALTLGSTVFGGTAPLSFSWTPAGDLSCTDCPDPTVAPLQSTLYTLQVSDANGCAGLDSVFIRLDTLCLVYPVTAFSPNGDGTNDWFFPKTDPCVRLVRHWAVYSRWGELVFERRNFAPNDETLGWDGTRERQPAPTDVYVWLGEVEYFDGRVRQLRGEVAVLR